MQALQSELTHVIKEESRVEAEIEENLESLLRLDSTKSATVTVSKNEELQNMG